METLYDLDERTYSAYKELVRMDIPIPVYLHEFGSPIFSAITFVKDGIKTRAQYNAEDRDNVANRKLSKWYAECMERALRIAKETKRSPTFAEVFVDGPPKDLLEGMAIQ